MSKARESPIQSAALLVGRHLHWVRSQGLGQLVEEDDPNPLARSGRRPASRCWRRAHGVPPGAATAVRLQAVRRPQTASGPTR